MPPAEPSGSIRESSESQHEGERGTGYRKSMPAAAIPCERLGVRLRPPAPKGDGAEARSRPTKSVSRASVESKSTDLIVDVGRRELLKKTLEEEGVNGDHDGNRRTARSLRRTNVCRAG